MFRQFFSILVALFSLTIIITACDGELQLSNVQFHKKEKSVPYIKTFQINTCERITLEYHKKMSDSRDGVTPKRKDITDKTIINKILSLTKELPNKGDIMIKMGDVPLLNVFLSISDSETVYFSFYNSRVKTPDTSFYSQSKAPQEEQQLFELLTTLLN